MSHNSAVFALYRAFLRQTRKLPHLYLRQFWRIKASDDVRAILATDNAQGIRDRKFDRMSKDLRKVEGANNRNAKAFDHILDVAYARKGKLRHETMEPILTDPTEPIPPKIIPAVEKSRPPVYSQELTALLTSPHSRIRRPLDKKHLACPTTLPARADPASADARLLGPFSKRRETNIRWRYFVAECKKTRSPLQVVLTSDKDRTAGEATVEAIGRAGIRGLTMQGLRVFEDVEDLAGPRWICKPPTRRGRPDSQPPPQTRHPSRWVRRRYQALLSRLPVLTYFIREGGNKGTYSVGLSANQMDRQTNIAVAGPMELDWLQQDLERPIINYGNSTL